MDTRLHWWLVPRSVDDRKPRGPIWEDEFVTRWNDLLSWTRENYPALIGASLLRSTVEPNRFLSFAEWKDAGSRAEWKGSDGFAERMGSCKVLCSSMEGSDFARVIQI